MQDKSKRLSKLISGYIAQVPSGELPLQAAAYLSRLDASAKSLSDKVQAGNASFNDADSVRKQLNTIRSLAERAGVAGSLIEEYEDDFDLLMELVEDIADDLS